MQPNYGLLQAVAPALHKLVKIARSVFHKHLRWLVWQCCANPAVKTHNLKVAFTVTQKEAIMNEWNRLSFTVKWLCSSSTKIELFFKAEIRFWYFIVELSLPLVPPTSGVIPNKRGRGEVYNRNLLTFPDIYIIICLTINFSFVPGPPQRRQSKYNLQKKIPTK